MPLGSDVALSWSAHEHEHIERGSDWFWALGITAVCIAVASILFDDFLFAILVLVAAATMALLARTPPQLVQFEVSDRGIRVGSTLHRYDEIISFWVEDEHHIRHPQLLVDTVKFMSPNIIIPLEHIDPGALRAYLRERVNEVPMKEPLSHKIIEFIGL